MSDTREEILNLAEDLIRTKGYNAFSYRDISVPLNIKNAAIHYHFNSKADLGKAIINRTRQNLIKESNLWKDLSPVEQLNKFISIYEQRLLRNQICFMGALGPSYETLPEQMQIELTQASKEIRAYLRNVLQRGLDIGSFNFTDTVSEKADMIIASLLSSLILTRVTKENIFAQIRNTILKGV
ncbi:TetR/AcrR family transcriptional regulator [Chondrinema litorale]|uniref:TetR/AcrR family transcriptional regulator n=1 Tax=Chondrinema litorale TaxID=2994555 RepID=UPI002543E581|nr:helix-turn-helix domain-containing protein [Chondrinema litorale]UZR98594.1 helix-turn-helix domain containing protein [Chondrinema litorale]